MTDSEQAQALKALYVNIFNTVAAGYDSPALRFFPFSADKLVNLLQPRHGDKLLDVATGTGAVAVACGQAVGHSGRVMAIDLSTSMLDRAEANIRKMALNNVDLYEMDAANPEFRNDYFDATLCGFALFFLPDMLDALRRWQRVTKPGGQILFSSFAEPAFQPMRELLFDDLEACGATLPKGRVFGSDRLNQAAACEQLMREAGLEDVEVSEAQLGYHLRNADDWWEIVWNSGMRGLLELLPVEARADFQRQHLAHIAELADDNGIWLDCAVLFSRGRVPSP